MKRLALLALIGLAGCSDGFPANYCDFCGDADVADAAPDADARDGGVDADDAGPG